MGGFIDRRTLRKTKSFSHIVWFSFYTQWNIISSVTLLAEAKTDRKFWWILNELLISKETIGLQEICNCSLLRNLINWIRLVIWKLFDPRVRRRSLQKDFNAPVYVSGDLVVWDISKGRLFLIDSLSIDKGSCFRTIDSES